MEPSKITIREFRNTIEDAKRLKEIDALTFKDCKYSETEIINILKSKQNKVFMAEYDCIAVGFISLIQVKTLHYHGMWVDLVAVNPKYQKLGIGKKLVEYAIKYGKESKIDMVSALVAYNNLASKRIFEKENFLAVDKEYNLFLQEINDDKSK